MACTTMEQIQRTGGPLTERVIFYFSIRGGCSVLSLLSMSASMHWCFGGGRCTGSELLSWQSCWARCSLPALPRSPPVLSSVLSTGEEPGVRNELPALCFTKRFVWCLCWGLQKWKTKLLDDVGDTFCVLSLSSSLSNMLGHPRYHSGYLKETGFSQV